VRGDTAGAAMEIADKNDKTQAAIASALAGEIYGLDILARDIEDNHHNKTRFIILSKNNENPKIDEASLTSFVFEVKNIPPALYKAMGGFATNGINMVKLESYVDEKFNAARFYCEVEGHCQSDVMRQAFEELGYFAKNIKILGCYPKSSLRDKF
jgi:prephenate dehydratase